MKISHFETRSKLINVGYVGQHAIKFTGNVEVEEIKQKSAKD